MADAEDNSLREKLELVLSPEFILTAARKYSNHHEAIIKPRPDPEAIIVHRTIVSIDNVVKAGGLKYYRQIDHPIKHYELVTASEGWMDVGVGTADITRAYRISQNRPPEDYIELVYVWAVTHLDLILTGNLKVDGKTREELKKLSDETKIKYLFREFVSWAYLSGHSRLFKEDNDELGRALYIHTEDLFRTFYLVVQIVGMNGSSSFDRMLCDMFY